MYRIVSCGTQRAWRLLLPLLLISLLALPALFAQETTAGLQGTVKDPSGAGIAKASVEVTSPALIGIKKMDTDAVGAYRFANLPPGIYTVTVTATGFRTYRAANIELQVGHLPTVEVRMEIGAVAETVEVSAQSAAIDPTQSKVQTNISATNLMDLPTQSLSFQSVIQFAPGARFEPLPERANQRQRRQQWIPDQWRQQLGELLPGGRAGDGVDCSTGDPHANVPMDFIQEVQVKTNGFEAEYGGALGGVVNVIPKERLQRVAWQRLHVLQGDRFNAAPNPTVSCGIRSSPPISAARRGWTSPAKTYYPVKDHSRTVDPGFTLGGPMIKDRLWLFISGAPGFQQLRRTVNFAPAGSAVGPRTFNQDTTPTIRWRAWTSWQPQKIRLHGSWQYGYPRGKRDFSAAGG